MYSLPKTLTKNELLDWLNQQTSSQGVNIDKIEHLGNGVGFITLFTQLHPGVIPQNARFIKKPKSEFENITNLKLLATSLMKVGVNKPIDISKLSKMKLQDNLLLLQWFYSYAQSLIKKEQQNKCGNIVERGKKLKCRAPTVLKRTTINKFDSQNQMLDESELKTISSNSKILSEIDEIIHNQTDENSSSKMNRIKTILGFGTAKKEIQVKSSSKNHNLQPDIAQIADKSNDKKQQREQEQYKSATRDPIFSFKSQSLEERCQSYLKKSAEQQIVAESKKKGVRVSVNNLIYEYENENERGRFTDTSMLLNSERKSIQSEGNLLNQEVQ